MKIAITGKDGFIAKNLASYLKCFYDVSCLDKDDWFDKPDVIFHLAAEIYDENKMFESNVMLSKKILDYCVTNPVKKLVIFGSSSEYGRKQKPISEQDRLEP